MNSTVAVRLDRLPVGRFHYRILWLIGSGMFFDAFDIYLGGSVLGALVKSGWSTVDLNARFISVTFLGLLLGAWTAGFLGDHFGRQFSYQVNLLVFGFASLAAALAPNMTSLIIIRGVIGIGLGAEIVMGYATFSEFVPAISRGKWLAYLAIITNIGLAASALLGFLIIPALGWRWMFVFVGAGALVVWYFRRLMPESPRWYEARGQRGKAEEIVAAIEKEIEKGQGAPLPSVEVQKIILADKERQSPYLNLFRGYLLRRTILASLMFISQSVAVYSLVNWLPTIFVKQGINISKSLEYNTLTMIGGPFGAFLASLVVDRLGRKWTSAFLFLACGVVGYGYAFQTQITMVIIYGFILLSLLYMLNPIIFALYPPELFPTEIRLRGCGTANALGRLANIGSPYVIAWLLIGYGSESVFKAISAVLVSMAIIMAIIGIETKKRPLEQTSSILEPT